MKKDDVPPEALRQNLEDAGSTRRRWSAAWTARAGAHAGGSSRLLSAHQAPPAGRRAPLRKQITCLDYLVFQIEREERAGQSGPPPGRKKPTKRGTF